jgi:Bardet-Biedl syndrome 2 protein
MYVVGEMLIISLVRATESGQSVTRVRILTDNMDLAADLVQDMTKYLNWTELESEAEFPAEFEQFEQVVKTVAECSATRSSLTADMAEDAQRIKALIIRAEDSRLMLDMISMRRAYTELGAMNNQLITSYNIRAQNHETLLAALKEVNQMIQRAANLRCGKAKARVVGDCRGAVKTNNMQALFRVLRQGHDPSSVNFATAAAQSKK